MKISVSASVLALVAATPSLAQEAAPAGAQPAEQPAADATMTDSEVDAIVVTAARVRGQVDTASAPVLELDPAQVQAYGAASIADLVEQLAPQIGSGRGRGGRPVFLVNGQRIGSFREIGRYPPEAIRKVEVFPEEVALQYGYPADQRVINFILQDNFASRELEVEYGQPTAGGNASGEVEVAQLTINGPDRLSVAAEYRTSSLLTEAERGIVQTPGSSPSLPGDPDPALFRSLAAESESYDLEGTWQTAFGEGADAATFSLNVDHERSFTRSLSGLDTVLLTSSEGSVLRAIDDDPLERRGKTTTTSLASAFNKPIGDWTLSITADGALTNNRTIIDRRRDGEALQALVDSGELAIGGVLPRVSGAGFDTARSDTYTIDTLATLSGRPLLLPSGEVSVTVDAGYKLNGIDSTDTRNVGQETSLDRRRASAGINLGIPIASAREGFLEPLGELNLNLSGGIDRLSDFGTLTDWTSGLTWQPSERLSLQASYTMREVAPTLTQLGDPQITSFNVPVYDFTTGETVLIAQTSGGNPLLQAETQRDLKLSASYDLDLLERANILVEYYRNSSSDVTSGFPLLTPAIEAAFPGRVTREEATGRLLALDARPVTFAETRSERVRYGFNLFGKVGKPLPEGERSRGGGRFGALIAAAQPAPAPATAPAPTGAQQATGQGRAGSGIMSMDPQRLAELRTQFCASPAGTIPDLSALPQQMQDRLKGADGQVDPERVAVMRERLCDPDAARRFDPARFAAMRQALCADPAKEPDPAAIPQEVRERLMGPDGTISPERLREFQSRICALPTGQERAADQVRQQGDGRGQGGGRRGGGMGGDDGQGRWNVGLYHTINLANSVLVAPGGPFLDLLDGDATGSGGGVARHQIELEGGVFYRGIGVRLSGNYTGPSTVRGSGLPGSGDLFFGDLATFNLRSFIALDQQEWLVGEEAGFFKDARLSLSVRNIFDARQRVTDGAGAVPLRYQPFLIDPVGRFVEIEFRKLF